MTGSAWTCNVRADRADVRIVFDLGGGEGGGDPPGDGKRLDMQCPRGPLYPLSVEHHLIGGGPGGGAPQIGLAISRDISGYDLADFFSVSFFLTFSCSCFGDVFDHFWHQNGDQNAPKWHPKASLFRDLFFTRSRYQKYVILGPSDPQIHASRAGEVHFHTFSRFSYFSQKCEIFVSKMTSFWHTWTA